MYVLQLSGYGTEPTQPPQPGFQWLRYNDPNGGQARRCPSPAQYGCYMIDGYAWGQIQIEQGELSQPEEGPTAEELCRNAYDQWAAQYPAQARCMNSEDRNRYYTWCLDAVRNPSRAQQYMATWAQLVERRCSQQQQSPPPEPPPRPPPPPPTQEERCALSFDQWRQYYPNQAACLQPGDREQFLRWCTQLDSATSAQRFQDLVQQRCAPPSPPPTQPPVQPPTQPPVSPPPSDMTTPIPTNGDAPQQPPTQKPSLLRQVGPIVGIGLVAAIALTLLRK